MALFPESANTKNLSIEGIASRLSSFYEQIHLIHWQTTSIAEHQALGSLYDKLIDYKDDIIEKLMGYTGQRPKAFIVTSPKDGADSRSTVNEIVVFAKQLEEWAEEKEYCDIENIAQSLSGDAAKILYLLTLS